MKVAISNNNSNMTKDVEAIVWQMDMFGSGYSTALKADVLLNLTNACHIVGSVDRSSSRTYLELDNAADFIVDIFTEFETLLRNSNNKPEIDSLVLLAGNTFFNAFKSIAETPLKAEVLSGRYLQILLKLTKIAN